MLPVDKAVETEALSTDYIIMLCVW